jgi:hypothetical protein
MLEEMTQSLNREKDEILLEQKQMQAKNEIMSLTMKDNLMSIEELKAHNLKLEKEKGEYMSLLASKSGNNDSQNDEGNFMKECFEKV